jgi:hypothetical protein
VAERALFFVFFLSFRLYLCLIVMHSLCNILSLSMRSHCKARWQANDTRFQDQRTGDARGRVEVEWPSTHLSLNHHPFLWRARSSLFPSSSEPVSSLTHFVLMHDFFKRAVFGAFT